jgi:hypothetical protein
MVPGLVPIVNSPGSGKSRRNYPAPATGSGSIAAAPSSSRATPAPGAPAMASGLASILAKLYALIGAISKEAGFLEKVLG